MVIYTQFYVLSLFLVGLLVPYDHPSLLSRRNIVDAKASPFVVAIEDAGIQGRPSADKLERTVITRLLTDLSSVLPSIFNAVILLSVLSVGNTSIYATSRTLSALADRGQAPQFLSYIDRRGRPLISIALSSSFGLLAYVVVFGHQTRMTIFNWLLAISGLSTIITWGTICLCHIRFRQAWRAQGHLVSELAFTSQPGVLGSWIGLGFNIVVVIAQFWIGFAPVGWENLSARERASSWFQANLAAPVAIVMYIFWKWRHKTKIRSASELDLTSGRREEDNGDEWKAILTWERENSKRWPKWKKIYKMFC